MSDKVFVHAKIKPEVEEMMRKYVKANGYKISEFVEIAIKHELESRLYGIRRKIW